MSKFNTGQSFADGDTVTGAKLNNITGLLDIYTGLISEQTAISATVSTADQLLIADTDNGDSGAANRVTVQKLLNDTLTNGTYTDVNLTRNLNVTQLSTLGTISSTTGTIQTLTSGTANISQGSAIFTQGTIATLNSTTGTIGTLVATGTITGSTNVVNIGSGQIYKDASGNVGIGTTSPIKPLDVSFASGTRRFVASYDDSLITIKSANASNNPEALRVIGDNIRFNTGTVSSGTEAMRIDSSGNVRIGTTSFLGGGGQALSVKQNTDNWCMAAQVTTNGNYGLAAINASNSVVGGMIINDSSTSFPTSSDYRLKTNIEPIINGIERVKQLPVYRFNWKIDEGGNKVDGFVAHEAKAIVPESVVGEKDAVDADGKPIYQGIDQSKIVPLLTAALKEAIARIETLEAKVTALEAA